MGQPGRAEPRPPRSALLLQLSPEPRLSDQGGPVGTGTEGAQPTARGWGRRGIRRGSGTLAFGAHTHPLPSLERGTRPRTHPRLRSRRRWSRGWNCKGAGRGWSESQEAGSRPGCYPDKLGLICCRLQPEAPFLPGLCAFLPRLCACSPAVAQLWSCSLGLQGGDRTLRVGVSVSAHSGWPKVTTARPWEPHSCTTKP